MTIKQFEDLIISELTKVVDAIVKANLKLDISAKSRAGAEISDWLEEKFVEKTKKHKYFQNSEFAPKSNPKHPWDAKTTFKYKGLNENIYIDFKAFKVSSNDSNPKMGSPDKIIKLINGGSFYHTFIFVYYKSTQNSIKFTKKDKKYVRSFFMKDINNSFYRDSTNQLQVNFAEPSEYRTREEFINLLEEKLEVSYQRQIKNLNIKKKNLKSRIAEIKKVNSETKDKLIKNLE